MKKKHIGYIAINTLLIAFLFFFNSFEALEAKLQDRFFYDLVAGDQQIDSDIIIIGIDEQSISDLGSWPWRRSTMASLINYVKQGNPAAIGIDVIFSGASQNPEDDAALAEAAKDANVVLAVKATLQDRAAVSVEKPYPALLEATFQGHINNIADSDGVIRKALLEISYADTEPAIKSFDTVIYELYAQRKGLTQAAPETDRNGRYWISFNGTPFSYEHHSFSQVINGKIPPEYFQDKIVLVGPYDYGMQDSFYTAVSGNQQMHGVEIHANILQNMIYQNYKQSVPFLINLGLMVLLGIGIFWLSIHISPARGLLVAILISIIYYTAAAFLFHSSYLLSIFYPLLQFLSLYVGAIVYKYLEEFKERNRITNFFTKYVAQEVVSEIIKSGEEKLALGGSRKEVSILFVDIRGFTPLSESQEPETIVGILNEYLNLTATSIFNHSGMLDKFIGDATMAIFNAPFPLTDHAYKAVLAALQMRDGGAQLNRELEKKYGMPVAFGIGIHTGYAVIGNIGAENRMDYTAIGDTVNTAARLEGNAKPGQILVSAAVYEQVKDRIDAEYIGEVSVKGKAAAIEVYNILGIKGKPANMLPVQPGEQDNS